MNAADSIVVCAMCGKVWNALNHAVQYRSLDLKWWCADEAECTARRARNEVTTGHPTTSLEDLDAMRRGLEAADQVFQKMLDEGWKP